MKNSRVCLLPPLLANQIAAGEVVERPASVVKELVENSLDAGATQIEVELEEGGVRLIRVVDDGIGIHPEDMALSLARHATSKITSIDDLHGVQSLGFRGEALASIASVSRLSLTSCRQGFAALVAQSEGLEQRVNLKPAAHPVGCRIEVADLFFNTPVRRKFLKSERTEFSHVEDWLRRIALARPDVAFSLRHNRRQIFYWPTRPLAGRLAQALGSAFIEQAKELQVEKDSVRLHGFLADGRLCRLPPECLCFVNGRAVKDRLLGHALRQAANEAQIPELAGALFIDLPPERVDVNVHPTKHEVRFRHARWLHDFLVSELLRCLQPSAPESAQQTPGDLAVMSDPERDLPVAGSRSSPASSVQESPRYYPPAQIKTSPPSAGLMQSSPLGRLVWLEREPMGILECRAGLWLFDAQQVQRQLLIRRLDQAFQGIGLIAQPVLIPRSLVIPIAEQQALQRLDLARLGMAIDVQEHRLKVLQWPALLRGLEPADFIELCRQHQFNEPDLEFWQRLADRMRFGNKPPRLLEELEVLWPLPARDWGQWLPWPGEPEES